MTTAEFIERLPRMRELFPKEVILDFSLAEYLVAIQQQAEATLAGLDAWREQSPKMENE